MRRRSGLPTARVRLTALQCKTTALLIAREMERCHEPKGECESCRELDQIRAMHLDAAARVGERDDL